MTVFGIKSKGMDKSGQAQNPVKNGGEGATERFDRCALAERVCDSYGVRKFFGSEDIMKSEVEACGVEVQTKIACETTCFRLIVDPLISEATDMSQNCEML